MRFIGKTIGGMQTSISNDGLIYDDMTFSNAEGQFGLYIKLTKSASETPTVDVIIN